MKICHVYQDQFPWDVRVEKISDSLAAAGHPTVVVSRNRRGLARREELRPGIHVNRLPAGWTGIDRALMNFPAFFSPWWLSAIVRTVRQEGSDLILVRDLPLTPTAVWAGRLTGRPVVMDMAENYPAMLQAARELTKPTLVDHIVRNPSLLRRLERWILPQLDGIFVVSDPSRERVVALTGNRIPVWVINNTPRLGAPAAPLRSEIAAKLDAQPGLVLLYVGFLDAKRGLDVVIQALPEMKKVDPNVLAVIVGTGHMEERLRTLARELDVEANVLMTGWIDQREVPSIVAASDIGLIPHFLNEHTDTTIPNKIFDYMAQGLPVVVTHCRTLRGIVEAYDCGRVCRDRDPDALAAAVKSLADAAVRERLGEAGRRAVLERFNWDHDAQTVLSALTGLVDRRPILAA